MRALQFILLFICIYITAPAQNHRKPADNAGSPDTMPMKLQLYDSLLHLTAVLTDTLVDGKLYHARLFDQCTSQYIGLLRLEGRSMYVLCPGEGNAVIVADFHDAEETSNTTNSVSLRKSIPSRYTDFSAPKQRLFYGIFVLLSKCR